MAKSGYFFRVSPLDQHANKLNKIIQDLIKQNVFSRVVRDAIRLYADLSDGKTEVLEELFPFVRNHYCNDSDPDELRKVIDDAVNRAINKQRPMNNSHIPDTRESGFPLMSPTPKPSGKLGSISLSMPAFDDDDDLDGGNTIILNKSTSSVNGANLLASIMKISD